MIFSKWRRSSLKLAWEYATAGVLWRLVPSKAGVFVLEDRNVDAKNVTFAGIDMLSGAVLWKDVSLDERWWVSVELIEEDHVILHGYGSPDMPDHRKIFVLDLRTGALRWQNADLALLFAGRGAVYATKEEFERRRYFALALASGQTLGELEAAELDALQAAMPQAADTLVTFPQACGDPRDLDDGVRRVVASMADARSAPGLIEVLRRGEYEAVAVHLSMSTDPARPSFTQRLAVRRRDETVFEDVMSTNAAMSAPDGFFAVNDMLYYVKDQRILRALPFHGT